MIRTSIVSGRVIPFLALLLWNCLSALNAHSIAYTWNGTVSSDWNTATNWTPNGIPTTGDNVTIAAGTFNPALTANADITNLTLNSGADFDLSGFTLTASGAFSMVTGSTMNINGGFLLLNGTAAVSGGSITNSGAGGSITANTTSFTFGTAGSSPTISADITVTSVSVTFRNTTFNGTTVIEKTGTSNDACVGNNTFNGPATIINSSNSNYLILANTTRDIFNNTVTFDISGSNVIYVAHNDVSGTQFNDNVFVQSSGTGSIRFGQNVGTAVLATGKTISVGSSGFNSGALYLRNFTQSGSTPQSFIQTSGLAFILLQSGTVFNGVTTINFPQITFSSTTFNDSLFVTKNATGNNNSTGNNTFNSYVSITNSSAGAFTFSNTTNDEFNGDVVLTCTSTGALQLAQNDITGPTHFNGNITVNCSGSGGVRFGQGTGSASLANGKVISVGAGFTTGGLFLRNFEQVGTTAQELTLTGNAIVYFQVGSDFNGPVTVTSPSIRMDGALFNATTYFTKTGTANDLGTGGNIFNQPAHFTNTGTGFLQLNGAGNDQYNDSLILESSGGGFRFGQLTGTCTLASGKLITIGPAGFSAGGLYLRNFIQTSADNLSFNLTGSSSIYLQTGSVFQGTMTVTSPTIRLDGATYSDIAYFTKTGTSNDAGAGGNTFNNDVYITVTGSGFIQSNGAAIDQFNGNIIVESTGGGIRFGQNAGTCLLATGKIISIGPLGFSSGGLYLRNFIQSGSDALNLILTGTSSLYLQSGSIFNGNVDFTAPTLRTDGSTYNGTAALIKTGSTGDSGTGGNTFNGTVTITNTGTGFLQLNGAGSDAFNADVIVECTSTGGIRFGQNAGTSMLANGYTITTGPAGYATGSLYIRNFIQNGTTPQLLALTGNAALYLQTGSVFNADVDFSAPQLFLNGATYHGITVLTKNGATNNNGNGGNTFNGVTTLINSGSGYLLTSFTTRDVFNADLNVINSGTSLIHLANNDNTGTQFNGDVYFASTSGTGITIGGGVGTSTLAAGRTLNVHGSGFSIGTLTLRNFTQNGSTAQSITLTGTAGLAIGPGSTINADFTASSPAVFLNGCTYNGVVSITKTGTTADNSNGNNTFNGVTTLSLSASGNFVNSNTTRDIYNNDVTFSNTAGSILYVAQNDATGTQFNGDVYFNNTGTGSIRIGQGTGTSTLASGNTLNLLSFTRGRLYFRNFTQAGTTPQTLSVTSGTGSLFLQVNSTWNGNVTFNFPQMNLNGGTFNGTATIQKNGATNNTSTGGCVFNNTTLITNSGTGNLILANSAADDFNGSVTFRQTGTGILYPAYNANCTFSGDISTAGTSTAITFASFTAGAVTIDGSLPQQFNGASAQAPGVRQLIMNGAGGLTLNVPVTITGSLTMTNGLINTSSSSLLIIANGITGVAGTNNNSFVNGPVRKVGNQAFVFPTGKSGYYRPIGISAPTATTEQYVAEYFPIDPNSSWDVTQKDVTIDHISRCEYWILNRIVGASNVFVTLSWNVPSCGVTVLADLVVTRWDVGLGRFRDMGNAATTGTTTQGTVLSNITAAAYGTFTFGSNSGNNPLPVELTSFNVKEKDYKAWINWETASELNCDRYVVEKSKNGIEFESFAMVNGNGTKSTTSNYSLLDQSPYSGTSFYRLTQVDYDGTQKVFDPVKFVLNDKVPSCTIIPNPFRSSLQIKLNNISSNTINLKLTDLSGKTIVDKRSEGGEEVIFTSSELPALPSGIYFLQISDDRDLFLTQKVVKE